MERAIEAMELAFSDDREVPVRSTVGAVLFIGTLHRAVTEGREWLEKARTVAKRLSGISKEQKPVLHAKDVFEKDDDARIVDVIGRVDASTRELTTEEAVTKALRTLRAEGWIQTGRLRVVITDIDALRDRAR